MNTEFMQALDELVRDRGIDKDVLLETIEQALTSAYKKNFGSAQNVRIDMNRETGDIYLVADVLGHKDVNTTKKHYAAIEEDRRRKAANIVKLRKE